MRIIMGEKSRSKNLYVALWELDRNNRGPEDSLSLSQSALLSKSAQIYKKWEKPEKKRNGQRRPRGGKSMA